MKNKRKLLLYVIFAGSLPVVFLLCVCMGSVEVPWGEALALLGAALRGQAAPDGLYGAIVLSLRLPRVLCAGLMGAALSLCGAAMQGLLRNPLADGSTLGVSSGAALGAAVSIVLGVSIPGLPLAGAAGMAMLFAFGSLAAILALAYSMDRSLSTHTLILIGVIFSMLVSSLLSLLITFSGEKLRTITYWTMGSLSGKSYSQAGLLALALFIFGAPLLFRARELNAFALGEDNALHVGVPVKRVKLTVMAAASALIGVCVSVGGSIAFVGLIIPHVMRMLSGPDHRHLLPLSMIAGASFLMLADLLARWALRPLELPVGVVTSLIGAVFFLSVFYRSRKGGKKAC